MSSESGSLAGATKSRLIVILLINAVFLVTGYWIAEILEAQSIAYVLMFSLAVNWLAVIGLGGVILCRLLFANYENVYYAGALELILIVVGLIGWRVVSAVVAGLLA